MISPQNTYRFGNRLSTAKRQLAALAQQAAVRDDVVKLSLPRAGGEYSFVGNRLLRDGEPQPVRACR